MKKLFVNGIALILDIFIIIFLIVIKFNHGAWITIFVTGLIVVIAIFINRHYTRIGEEISNLNSNLSYLENEIRALFKNKFQSKIQDNKRTAIILVNGYNGTGLNLIINTIKKFGIDFSKIVFVQVGVVDAGIFKGSNEIENLRLKTETECNKYKKLFVELGIDALSYTGLGYDPAFELVKIIRELNYYYLNLIVFSGQIILKNDNLVNKLLHNNVANIIRNRLFELNIPYVMFPINVKLD